MMKRIKVNVTNVDSTPVGLSKCEPNHNLVALHNAAKQNQTI